MTTNSLVNMIMEGSKPAEPQIGMGATRLMWTDRKPCTIVEVMRGAKGGKVVAVQVTEDTAERIDNNGMSESQEYKFTSNLDGPRLTYTKRRNGKYVIQGSSQSSGEVLLVGHREKYHDYSF